MPQPPVTSQDADDAAVDLDPDVEIDADADDAAGAVDVPVDDNLPVESDVPVENDVPVESDVDHQDEADGLDADIDNDLDEEPGHGIDPVIENAASEAPVVRVTRRSVAQRVARLLAARYGQLPVWLLMAQAFLAIGWLRAAVAHAFSPGWRNGAEVDAFRLEHQDMAIEWYRDIVFDGLVGSRPGLVAVVVLISQLLVALSLGLNRLVPVGLGIGAFLNVNFLLAGAIDPSTFYLVISATIALWHIERSADPARSCWLTLISSVVGFTLIGALAPQIETLDPASVIEDPAIVLGFVTLLWIGALWLTFGRQVLALRPRRATPLTVDDWLEHEALDGPPPASDTVASIRLAMGANPVEAWRREPVGSGR